MRDYALGFISNTDFFSHVKETVESFRFTMSLRDFRKNLVDPIKLTFDSKVYSRDIEMVIESEIIRQMDRSNVNHIGYFHQNIFKHIGDGWSVPESGFDVVNERKAYFVEMKNKHNTMNSSSAKTTFIRMQKALLKYPNATCMLVEVIAKKSQNIVWKVRLDGEDMSDERIRRVSIDKFYELVTGDGISFRKMCEQLPFAIEDVVKEGKMRVKANSVVSELKAMSPSLLTSIFRLSFDRYEGFEGFHVT